MTNRSPGIVIPGAAFSGIAGIPPADMSEHAKYMAAYLPEVTWLYSPDYSRLGIAASPAQIHDQVRTGGKFTATSAGNSPTFGTSLSNSRPVSNHASSGGKGFGSNKVSVVSSLALIGYFEVNATSVSQSGTRTLFFLGDLTTYFALQLAGASDQIFWATPLAATGIESSGPMGAGLTAGKYVFTLDYNLAGGNVSFYLNNTETPHSTKTISGTPGPATGAPSIGCISPGSGGWEGPIGQVFVCAGTRLGGTDALNAARRSAMLQLGDYYGVSVATS